MMLRTVAAALALSIIPAMAQDAKETKHFAQPVNTDCAQLGSLYRSNLKSTGRPVTPMAAVQDSIVRHSTQQRLLWIAWSLRCDMRPFIDTEIEYSMGPR